MIEQKHIDIEIGDGRDGLFCYSLLKPNFILFSTAWGNISCILRHQKFYFDIWSTILGQLLNCQVPMLMIDFPGALHRYVNDWDKSFVTPQQCKERKDEYKTYIINRWNCSIYNFRYIDLAEQVGNEYFDLNENRNNEYNSAPWHVGSYTIDKVFDFFKNSKDIQQGEILL